MVRKLGFMMEDNFSIKLVSTVTVLAFGVKYKKHI
jgi:hypothetical protein